ncbi:MAG: response regulator [Synergistaceae bacterium]|jgi:putative two-component system response regulator|nr:response regulator [Synergistaceae bacterium]
MKQILIVDDNLIILQQIGVCLEGKYNVMLAKSGAQALSICEREIPDLILLDIEMPVMDGFETIECLKCNGILRHIPVIFLTASHDITTETRALRMGAVDFITKPVEKSILLHRIELHLELNDYQLNLKKSIKDLEDNIVLSFADLVECKDSNAGGHVLRTSRYLGVLGREMIDRGMFPEELTEDALKLMVQAAPFHDIGKIGISDVILLKPGELSDDEYRVVKQHTVIGSRVLSKIYERTMSQNYLKYASLMAEGHHERYDGTGYPYGLKGNEIPLCCRIISVVNVYDACKTDRVYRRAMDHKGAINVISMGRGTEFDPLIAEVAESIAGTLAAIDIKQGTLLGSWAKVGAR